MEKLPRDIRKMNQGDISSNQVTFSGTNSSKTVAEILKQVSGQQAPKAVTRLQEQPQNQTTWVVQGTEQNLQSSDIKNHLSMSKDSPHGSEDPSSIKSVVDLPPYIRNASPVRKKHNQLVATNNFSLSQEHSSPQVTAHTGKAVTESTPTNLLRSALQGNMPDPNRILNSKTEDGMLTAGSLHKNNPLKRKSPSFISSQYPSSDSISHSHHLNNTIRKLRASIGGAAGYLGQENIVRMDSKSSTIENLLTATDGEIQIINVSHIPKSTSDSSNNELLSGSVNSLQSAVAESANAMEVAQQIQVEASGQKCGAHLQTEMQQLKSQIQSSRSIDAQLAPQLTPVVSSKGQSVLQRAHSREIEQKILASPSAMSSAKLAVSSMESELEQQQQTRREPSGLLPLQPLKLSGHYSSLTPLSSTPSTTSSNVFSRRPSQNVNSKKLPIKFPMQQQQNLKKNLQQMKNMNLTEVEESHLKSRLSNGHSETWLHPWYLEGSDFQSAVMDISEIHSEEDKQQAMERLIQQSNMSSILTEMTVDFDESYDKHINFHHNNNSHHNNQNTVSPLTSSFLNVMDTIDQDFTCKSDVIRAENAGHIFRGTNYASLTEPAHAVSNSKPGEFQHIAANVGLNIEQLASVISPVRNNNMTGKDIKLHSSVNDQFCTTTSVFDSLTEQTSTRDSQTFIPVQTVNSSPALTCTVSASSSLSSSFVASTILPSPINLKQRSRHQQQNLTTKEDKSSVQNPFTFPTNMVKLHTDSQFNNPIYSTVTSPHKNICSSSDEIRQQELLSIFSHTKEVFVCPRRHQSDEPDKKLDSSISAASSHDIHEQPAGSPEVPHVEDMEEGSKITMNPPFNQRMSNLSRLPVLKNYRTSNKSQMMATQRTKSGVITDTSKTLDVLRQTLQSSMNKDIADVIKPYIDKFFKPALNNIKQNKDEDFAEEEYINQVCRQILEEAKTQFKNKSDRRSDTPDSISEPGSVSSKRMCFKSSRISDTDSEKGSENGFIFKRASAKKNRRPAVQGTGRVAPLKTIKSAEPVRREGPKWDPERLKPDTLFVMGARANKALGLGNTRGRLYIKHPDVFKYIGDQEDKQWLSSHNLMPPTGGKAYMLMLEDIENLSRSDDYKDSPGLMMHECVGFTVPDWMLVKIKGQMSGLDSSKSSLSVSLAQEVEEQSDSKILPFSSFAETTIKEEVTVPPDDTEEMEFLPAADSSDIQHSSAISPFHLASGFEDIVSPIPSSFDPTEDPQTDPSLFS